MPVLDKGIHKQLGKELTNRINQLRDVFDKGIHKQLGKELTNRIR